MLLTATALAACMWVALLALPWRPWSTREHIEAREPNAAPELLARITALIPARDEAECIARTLASLAAQGPVARIVLVDDQSTDGTGDIARGLGLDTLEVIEGSPPPTGWSGKLWALAQGARRARSEYTLLIDADIELAPGILAALARRLHDDELDLVSVMAHLHMATLWEKLLLPPFVFFFKLIYPFALANAPGSRVAAAAGGCVLLRSERLHAIGGFEALHDAIIDDCTLARLVKQSGGRTWLGLSRDVRAVRPYRTLANIWNMVARSAFTQLRYSLALLIVCTLLMLTSFAVPVVAVGAGGVVSATAALALTAMLAAYLPTLRFYDLSPLWAATLPVAGALFLAMTWTSAARYLRGERSRWKNRSYQRSAAHGP